MSNRLARATSPYLLQHKDNPVDWYEWGAEAFAEARRRDVPVILSVGYAACHWCHVMAHESFDDDATAALMNERFVNIKVDREERPDVDAVYMEAVQAMTGQGGWPMTVFLTPDRKPFYAGTYFPPEPRHGMPSFRQVLEAVSRTWAERRGEVGEAASKITEQLAEPRFGDHPRQPPTESRLAGAVLRLERNFDAIHAGFGSAPKFPPSMVLEFLLRHHARTGDEDALAMVERTCERMARGGIYDQLAGGFARYSVDRGWVVPHFEKMLYDNALLLRVYVHWWRASGAGLAERVVRETAEFLLRDLRTPEGGFASALDADAAGEEGLTYVWTPAELTEVLGDEDGSWAADLLRVTETGTFERGASTLQMPGDPDDLKRWERVRASLLSARRERPQPALDAKVVTAWNGLAIAGLAEAGALLGEPGWVDAARGCAELLWRVHLTESGRLVRTSMAGHPGQPAGVLEDYGDLAEGFLTLLAVTGDPKWLDRAARLLDVALRHFFDPESGGFFDTPDDGEELIRRPQDPTDNAAPSGWAATAGALLTYSAYTGSARHRTAAEAALGMVDQLAEEAPRFAGWGMAVAEAALAGPLEVAVVGPPGDLATRVLHLTALRGTSPGAAVICGDPAEQPAAPLLADRPLVGGRPAAYVCRHFSCDAPVTDVDALAAAVAANVPVES